MWNLRKFCINFLRSFFKNTDLRLDLLRMGDNFIINIFLLKISKVSIDMVFVLMFFYVNGWQMSVTDIEHFIWL